MTRPLRAMDKAAVLLDQITAVNALAVSAGVDPVSLKPLARMDAEAAIRKLFAKLSEISVAAGGDPIARPAPLHDDAAAIVHLEQNIVTVTATVDEGEEGGGEEAPEWVPEGFDIYVDLEGGTPQGRAWVAGTGEVAVDTQLGTDMNTDAGWGSGGGEYDAANLDADGYDASGLGVALIGDLLAAIVAGCTMVIDTVVVSNNPNDGAAFDFAVLSAAGDNAINFHPSSVNGADVFSWYGVLDTADILNVNGGILGAKNLLALTFTSTRVELAINGSDPEVGVIGEGEPESDLVAAIIQPNGVMRVRSIGVKTTPIVGSAGLTTLSETGVTNTAPTAIVVTADNEWSNVGPDITVADADLPPNGASTPTDFNSVLFRTVDAEGNMCVLTVVADNTGGKIGLGGVANFGNRLRKLRFLEEIHAADSPVEFTLRSTDPGGLFVEQEFTITVTA